MSTDHRSRPRAKRQPSERDQAIYVARMTRGLSQAELAEQQGLSQSRISQILRRVEKWRGEVWPAEAGELDHAQRQRVERWLEHQRQQAIYDRALAAFDRGPRELVTRKSGERGETSFHETTTRELPANVQLLKVAQRSAEALANAADKPAPPRQPDASRQQAREEEQMLQTLMRKRREAERAGKVRKSVSHQGDNFDFIRIVQTWLAVLLGEQPQPVNAVHLQPGQPLVEMAEAVAKLGRGTNFGLGIADLGLGDATVISKAEIPSSNASNSLSGLVPQTEPAKEVAEERSPEEFSPAPFDRELYRKLAADPNNLPAVREAAQQRLAEEAGAPQASFPGSSLGTHFREGPPSPAAPAGVASRQEPRGSGFPGGSLGTSACSPLHRPTDQPVTDPAARRRLHEEKLRQWELARRRGLPCLFEFDPADGPLPPRICQLDGAPA
jgi:transcriptional regulator with XRE-family HTH domain